MLTKLRLRAAWAIGPVYLILARPTVPLLVVGAAVALLGGVVRAWAAGTIRKNRVLATTGPYAYTRNPLYFGSFLIAIGLVIASGRWWFVILLVIYLAIYHPVMLKEEKRLERLFGDDYRQYESAVPRFFPRLRPARFQPAMASAAASTSVPVASVAPVSAVPSPPRTARGFFRRYLQHREYQALLGLAVTFLILAAKIAF